MPQAAPGLRLKQLAEGKGLLEPGREYTAEELRILLRADAVQAFNATTLAVNERGLSQGSLRSVGEVVCLPDSVASNRYLEKWTTRNESDVCEDSAHPKRDATNSRATEAQRRQDIDRQLTYR
jgi:hypothetical protein